jgi:hypothetical protein
MQWQDGACLGQVKELVLGDDRLMADIWVSEDRVALWIEI